ncbi:putative DNA-directed polymerase kappa [Pyronema domesticum]|nr:putative DNA-directed polymerase kappa [Pyronema domesticum]
MGQKFEEGLFKDLAPSFQRPREPISPPRKAADELDFAESSPASPVGVAAAAGAGVGGGSTSLHHSLLGPSLMKAGQEGVDQQKVGEIIYAASVGSKFFENEERRDEALTAKIEELLKKKAKLLPGQLKYEERKADEHIALLESERDLTQVIVHMDCDAFYASVEELDRPDLKLVPMAVGSGVLTTCNYQARKYGIRSGMAGHIAAKICPKLVFIKPNFEKYMKKAEEIRGVIAKYDPRYEATSVDEAYLNLTPYLTAHPELDPEELVHQIRSEILSTTQISISAGIGPNAKLAKVASNINKPNGQFYIPPTREAVMQFISSLPVRSINGVGRVFERELNSVGINTCGDIFTYRSYLMPLWGEKSFTFLLRTYLGIGRTTIRPISEYPRKSVGSETTFADISDPVKLREKLMKIAIELEADMGRVEVAGRTLILKIKMHDYQIFSRQKLCPRPIKTSTDLYNYSVPLLTALEREYPGLKLRLMGLRMTNLVNLAKRENVGSNFFGFQGQQLEQAQERRLTQELHDAIEASTKSATTSATKTITFAAANLNAETAPHTNPWEITRSSSKSPQKQPGPLSAFKESHQPSPPPDTYLCPICSKPQPADDIKFNQHIDWCLSRPVIKEATKQPAGSKASAAPNHGPRSRSGSKAPEPQEKQGKEKEKKKRRVEGFFEPRGRK